MRQVVRGQGARLWTCSMRHPMSVGLGQPQLTRQQLCRPRNKVTWRQGTKHLPAAGTNQLVNAVVNLDTVRHHMATLGC